MSNLKYRTVLTAAILALSIVGVAHAESHTESLDASDFRTITPEGDSLGSYYLVRIDVPRVLEGKEFLGTILEITVDVDARAIDGIKNQTPMLEVYALTDDLSNELDPSKFRPHSTMRRNVVVGTNRTIKIDIQEAIAKFMSDPESNHGLVLGSLTNTREGLLDVKSVDGRMAKITYYYMKK